MAAGPPAVLADRAVGADHAVARHHHRQRVGRAGRADGADRAGLPAAPRPPRSSRSGRSRCRAGGSARSAGSPRDSRKSSGRSNRRRAPAKYSSSSRATGSSRRRRVQDPRADPLGQGGQHLVVVLGVVGHPDQALVGRGQQQRADRGVERAVGHVEQAARRRRGRPAGRAARRSSASVTLGQRGQQAGRLGSWFMVIGLLPLRPSQPRRSCAARAMPSAAARRAASVRAADDGGDLGVGQSGQVVVGDRLPLLARAARPGRPEVEVAPVGPLRRGPLGDVGRPGPRAAPRPG